MRFHEITEAKRSIKPKLRPTAEDIAAIRRLREEIRAEEGGGGMCHWVSEVIMKRYGWPKEGGSVVDPKTGDVLIDSHRWNVLPDGAILDATIDQIGVGHDIAVLPKDHPLHAYYRLEWDQDYHPGHEDFPELKNAPHWKGEFDGDHANRLSAERGRYWYATDKKQHAAYLAQQRAYGDLTEAFGSVNYMVRWVDEKAIGPYLRLNGMKARVRHILPAKLSGHVHTKPWLGISFSHLDTNWRVGPDFIGFVVDRSKVQNQCFDIAGQDIFDLTQNLDLAKQGAYQFHDYRGALASAVEASKRNPDEVFLIGDLRNMSEALVEIRIKDVSDKVRKALTAYCQQHSIKLTDERAALTEDAENLSITDAILQVKKAYNDRGLSDWQIGDGYCSDFARDVFKAMGRPSDVHDVETNSFARYDRNDDPVDWDWKLLATHWAIAPPTGHSRKKLKEIILSGAMHVWLTKDKRHYDAETPNGVASFFELPFFRRWLGELTEAIVSEATDEAEIINGWSRAECRREANAWEGVVQDEKADDFDWHFEPDFPLVNIVADGLTTPKEWVSWMRDEIRYAEPSQKQVWKDVVENGVNDPIVIHIDGGKGHIWDGFHRVGGSYINKSPTIPAIVGIRKK